MFKIIKSDLILMKSSIWFYALFILIYPLFLRTDSSTWFVCFFAYLFVSGVLRYGEQCNINLLFRSLPVNSVRIVLSRYLEIVLLTALGLIWVTVIGFVRFGQLDGFLMLTYLLAALLAFSCTLPITYKFGIAKNSFISVINAVLTAVICSASGAVYDEFHAFVFLLLLLTAAVFAVLFPLTIRIYQKMDI